MNHNQLSPELLPIIQYNNQPVVTNEYSFDQTFGGFTPTTPAIASHFNDADWMN